MDISLNSIHFSKFDQNCNDVNTCVENFAKNNPTLALISIIALAVLGLALWALTIWLVVPGLTFGWTAHGWSWIVLPQALPTSNLIISILSGIAASASIGGSIYLNSKRT